MTLLGLHRAAGTLLYSLDAVTGERYPVSFHEATEAEVAAAALAAHQAFPVFRATGPADRAALLETIADELDALDQAFIAAASRETALPPARLEGERKRTTSQLRMFATTVRRGDFLDVRIDRAQPARQPLPRPDLRQYRVGVGPVAVFGAGIRSVDGDRRAGFRRRLPAFAERMRGQLTATLMADDSDLRHHAALVERLESKVGRLLFNGYPTGVEVSDAIVHGGPYPATTDARGTSVGSAAIERFLRPVCYQNYPDPLLPPALRERNPWQLPRLVDGVPTRAPQQGAHDLEAAA